MKLYGGYSIRRSLKDYGWAAALALSVLALSFSWAAFNPVAEVGNGIAGLVHSPADVQCLAGWTETTGNDPDGKINLKVCTSPDKRYIITVRESQAPVGYDGTEQRFLSPQEIGSKLR